MSNRVQLFLIGSGLILFAAGLGRISTLFAARSEDPFFAPHLLVTLLSLWIATSILRVGLRKTEITPRGALALIRSGSILLMIWSYRLYLVLKTVRSPLDLKAHFYLAFIYMVMGALVMLFGLRTSRALRRRAAQVAPPGSIPLAGAFSKDPAKK